MPKPCPSSHPKRVFLTGFMGSGKSTVGPVLAGRLGYPFCDLDEEIVRRTQMPIPRFFTEKGEAAFRKVEAATLEELVRAPSLVLALGGGSLGHPGSRAALSGAGVLVALDAKVATLADRLRTEAARRPLLSGHPLEARIEELLVAREPLYRLADLRIVVDGKSPAAIATEIEERMVAWRG